MDPALAIWWFTAALGAVLLSWFAVGLARFLAMRSGVIAPTGERHSHDRATPAGGGSGIVLAVTVMAILPGIGSVLHPAWLWVIVPGMLALGIMGWLDDRSSISPWWRFAVQLAVSLWLLAYLQSEGAGIGIGPFGPTTLWAWTAWLMLLVWIMNAYNFMDGSHGMAGFQGLYSALLLSVLFALSGQAGLAIAAFVLAGACAGFLPWNFPSPKVFMGDSGSVPLGFALAALLVIGVVLHSISWPVAALVLSLFLVDATLTLVMRVIRGERWYTPHRQHVYQRLIANGWSHSRVLVLYQAINLLVVLPVVVLELMYPQEAWLLTGLLLGSLVAAWFAASFKLGVEP